MGLKFTLPRLSQHQHLIERCLPYPIYLGKKAKNDNFNENKLGLKDFQSSKDKFSKQFGPSSLPLPSSRIFNLAHIGLRLFLMKAFPRFWKTFLCRCRIQFLLFKTSDTNLISVEGLNHTWVHGRVNYPTTLNNWKRTKISGHQ